MSQATRTDGELLAEFVSEGKETPFEALVERHGRLVLGVCRRVLGEHAEAEDAAQAVFLTLAHKAKSLRRHPSLAAWLHRVARNVALRARESRDRRRRREGEAGEMIRKKDARTNEPQAEQLLDGELDALPEKFRSALILRYMEGLSEGQASEALGLRTGTLSARLSRGRELLKQKLARRGVALSAGALTGLLAGSSEIKLPVAFAAVTAKAATLAIAGQAAAAGAAAANVALLVKGALNAMFWAKIKIAAAVLGTAVVVSAGVPAAVRAVKAAEPPRAPRASSTPPKRTAAEKPLKWKEIGNPLFYAQQRPWGTGNVRYGAWWSEATYRGGWEFYAKGVNKTASFPRADLKAKTVAAIYFKNTGTKVFEGIEKLVEHDSEVAVHYRSGKPAPRARYMTSVSRLLEFDRRDKPVIFYENGKRAAEVLPLRRPKGKGRWKAGLFASKRSHEAFRSIEQARAFLVPIWGPANAEVSWKKGGKDRSAAAWVDSLAIDFSKEMVLAALKGRITHTGYSLRISKVSVVNKVLRVDSAFTGPPPGVPAGKAMRYPYDLVACPRRDLPVVFYENGKEVARVPFAKAEDEELKTFLTLARAAVVAGKGKVRDFRHNKPNGPWLVRLEDCSKFYDGSGIVYGKARPNNVRLPAAEAARLKKGGVILFARDTGHVYGGNEAAIKWTAAREKAVKFALAPGWVACNRGYFRCPWCRSVPVPIVDHSKVPPRKCACGTPLAPGAGPGCIECSRMKGVCQMCKRTVGPATRGVELLLGTLDPLRRTKDHDPMKKTVPPRTPLSLWAAAKLTPGVKQAPELVCGGGIFQYCKTQFFVVDGPGDRQVIGADTLLRSVRGNPRARRRDSTLKRSGSRRVLTKGFEKPGTYTLRAVAGRLISNPITIVVSNMAKRLERPAQAVAVPRPAPVGGFAPRWKIGDTRVSAIHAASGKTIWTARMRFAIGNVVDNGKTWLVTSQDGAQQAVMDAKSGKMLSIKRLKPAAGGGEVF